MDYSSATDTTNKRLEGFSQRNPWNDRPLADNCFIRWSSDGAAVVAEAYSTIVYIINATIHRIDSRQRLQVSLFGLSFIYFFFFSFPFVFILILRLYIIEIVYNVWRFHWLVFFLSCWETIGRVSLLLWLYSWLYLGGGWVYLAAGECVSNDSIDVGRCLFYVIRVRGPIMWWRPPKKKKKKIRDRFSSLSIPCLYIRLWRFAFLFWF